MRTLLTATLILLSASVIGQVKIGDNPSTIGSSSILELESTNQAFVLTRLTTAQKNAMASPMAGMMVYDTDLNCVSFYNGSIWNCLTTPNYGLSESTPGESCKDILDSTGASTDGLYWIDPDGSGGNDAFQCYCDMTTDGGGWTLVGRGREGWAWNNAGMSTTTVHQNVGTTSAFTPSYYAATVIDDIMGKNVNTLTDGIRIKRNAHNVTDGSAYQEVRWFLDAQTTWSWLFDGGTGLTYSDVTIDGTSYGADDTRDHYASGGNDEFRIFTWAWGSHNNQRGFSYGSSVNLGTNSATNYLWENGTENHSIPYAEVYVRE